MKVATLVLIRRRGDVLLGRKITGEIGQGLLNAPGGKFDPEKDPTLRACAVREVREEVGICLLSEHLEEIATITFYAAGNPDFRVYVYMTGIFKGEPIRTKDMIPEWHHWSALPFHEMHDGDHEWFSDALGGQRFSGDVYYRERARGFLEFKRCPFTPFPTVPLL